MPQASDPAATRAVRMGSSRKGGWDPAVGHPQDMHQMRHYYGHVVKRENVPIQRTNPRRPPPPELRFGAGHE